MPLNNSEAIIQRDVSLGPPGPLWSSRGTWHSTIRALVPPCRLRLGLSAIFIRGVCQKACDFGQQGAPEARV